MGLTVLMMLAATAVHPDVLREQALVYEASGLVAYCREQAEERFAAQDRATYQWSASHKSRGNTLMVDGLLRLEGGKEAQVSCRLPRGRRLVQMTIDIVEK